MSEHLTYAAYKLQSEAVNREKEKLRFLGDQLLEVRKACEHEFVKGECTKCGQNEEVFNHLVARGDRPRPVNWDPASHLNYKFVD